MEGGSGARLRASGAGEGTSRSDEPSSHSIGSMIARATEIVESIFRRPGVTTDLPREDVEDARASILLRLVQRFSAAEKPAVDSVDHFAAKVAYRGLDDLLRARFAGRARLKRRIRYYLERDSRFVLSGSGSASICALAGWPEGRGEGTWPDHATATVAMLDLSHPADALHDIVAAVGTTVRIDELVNAAAELWRIQRRDETAIPESAVQLIPDRRPLISAELENRQALSNLWQEMLLLPSGQRIALLLHARDQDRASAIALLVVTGVADFTEVAAAVDLTPEQLEAAWEELPFDDNRIASILGATRQQVITLRRSARERLARRRAAEGREHVRADRSSRRGGRSGSNP